ncbi:hypothetical protein BaRGS_00009661 [Batillaria attramentaria]|uniref:Uncharacterized protein n=1 Tax=Batillaria attramentaria TaxID=370345 RepID=A0ABD0LHV7_9CAEN
MDEDLTRRECWRERQCARVFFHPYQSHDLQHYFSFPATSHLLTANYAMQLRWVGALLIPFWNDPNCS